MIYFINVPHCSVLHRIGVSNAEPVCTCLQRTQWKAPAHHERPPHFLLEPKGDDAAVGGVSRCLQSPRCAEESSVRRCAQTGRTGPVVKRQFNVKPGRHSERKQVSLSFSLNRSFENIQELFFYLFIFTANANERMLRMKYVWN